MFVIMIIDRIYMVYIIMLFTRILASWLPDLFRYRFMQFICRLTDPYLNLFRRIIPPLGMLDISPIFAFLALGFMKDLLIRFIASTLY